MGDVLGKLWGASEEGRVDGDPVGDASPVFDGPGRIRSARRLRRRGVRAHLEAALSRAGPFRPARRPFALRVFGRFLSGVLDTFGAIRGAPKLCSAEPRTVDLRTVMFGRGPGLVGLEEPSENSARPGKRRENLLLVVSPPVGGDERSPNVRALVAAGLSAGWSVAVHSRDKGSLFDPEALRECVEAARALAGPGALTGVVGLSVGAHEACKARLPYPVVSVSNGYDLGEAMRRMHPLARARVARRTAKPLRKALADASPEDLSCVRELLDARAPTLLVNSRNDPLVPDSCVEIGEAIAAEGGLVACVTTHRGGHLGFVGRGGQRWAFEAALGFLESAVVEV
jgi:hypothetical protein